MARYQLIAVLFLSMMGFAQEFSPTVPQDKTCTGTDVFTAYVAGKFTCTTFAGGSGITTLDTLSGATQTFSKTDDTNVTLTLTPSVADHNFALGWTGTLAKGRTLGTTVYTDQANTWSASTQEMDQAADGNTVLKMKRFTDTSPTGNFIDFRNAADNASEFSISVNGAVTAAVNLTAPVVNATTGFRINGTATTGKILVGNGLNIVLSTPSYPTSSGGAGTLIISSGTNFQGSNFTVPTGIPTAGKYMKSDATNYVASSGPASGTGTPTACTNQVVTGFTLNSDAAPTSTCTSLTGAFLPNPAATTLGGIESLAATTHQWINTISTSGVPSSTQPACGDLSNAAASCSTDATVASNIGSGTLPAGRMPALTGECTTSAGAVAVTCGSAIDHIVVSGTSTFTTSAVASGACQTTVTTAATGAVASTDTMSWNYTTAPTAATDGRLTIQMWITTDNVNFMRCNNTAASVTPTALVARWKVLR